MDWNRRRGLVVVAMERAECISPGALPNGCWMQQEVSTCGSVVTCSKSVVSALEVADRVLGVLVCAPVSTPGNVSIRRLRACFSLR